MAEYKGKVNVTELREAARKVFAYRVEPEPEREVEDEKSPECDAKRRPPRRHEARRSQD